ncbi:probable G-protein coupled receptor Mth-like 5 [Anopheles aquasalis]|uniref:probable G-protein coupled receptor Mth-like 5 n=1 Tax=Anopheles aquasalis TaxID=42839 RepID=UPI00215A9115|nr:probable G-protein coupled receptor Mth-like 5 [Anopheles aquasalis]
MAKQLVVATTDGGRLVLALCGVLLLGLMGQLGSAATTASNAVRVNKCCEKFEVMYDGKCTVASTVNATVWTPEFIGRKGERNVKVDDFRFVIGLPDCGTKQKFNIYHYPESFDKLILFPDGQLRHLILHEKTVDNNLRRYLDEDYSDAGGQSILSLKYDYVPGLYCMDQFVSSSSEDRGEPSETMMATVCSPKPEIHWTDSSVMLRKIINPICHGIAMIILLIVAIIYFVLPTLRDLVGNMVTTITMCLIVSQAADLVRIFTEFSNHVSFLIADLFFYVSLLGAFFWLNAMGYYIWKMFRTRNVFLRVSDGRKYCWYSGYAWGCTATMASIAVFAHYFLDLPGSNRSQTSEGHAADSIDGFFESQDSISWLGIAVFFMPIAFIIIVNIFFFVTTLRFINRMHTYGRIHHKLRCSFVMFTLIFATMSVAWLFLILSWLHIDGLLYMHIIANALQAPCILYICVLRQKHVTFLVKSCLGDQPPQTSEWGDEMTYMNGGNY